MGLTNTLDLESIGIRLGTDLVPVLTNSLSGSRGHPRRIQKALGATGR